MSDSIRAAAVPFLGQLPNLLVYIAGGILAIVMWKRCARACAFVAAAVMLLLMMAAVQPFVFQLLFQVSDEDAWESEKLHNAMLTVSVVNSCFHALAIGLLIAAAFVGRSRVERDETV